jgi:hypothetical protein
MYVAFPLLRSTQQHQEEYEWKNEMERQTRIIQAEKENQQK